MKKKIAILYSGFMRYYLNYFLDLCCENNIDVDLLLTKDNNFEHRGINKIYVNSLKSSEEEINSLININDYDCFLSDDRSLSFGCNIVHYNSLAWRINSEPNFFYRKILEMLNLKKVKNDKTFFKNCSKFIAVSNIVKEDIIKNYNISADKISVVHPGLNAERNKIEDKSENDKFIIGVIACGFTTKGGYVVLSAIKKLLKRTSIQNIEVRFINPKIDKQLFLKLYLKFFKLEKYVKFYPYQNDIAKFYNELNCLICASKYEAFGRVVTEAMINMVPVIIGSNIGATDIIKDGNNGFIFKADKNRKKHLADKLEEFICNYQKYSHIKDNAYNTAINCTWESFAKGVFNSLFPNTDISNN